MRACSGPALGRVSIREHHPSSTARMQQSEMSSSRLREADQSLDLEGKEFRDVNIGRRGCPKEPTRTAISAL